MQGTVRDPFPNGEFGETSTQTCQLEGDMCSLTGGQIDLGVCEAKVLPTRKFMEIMCFIQSVIPIGYQYHVVSPKKYTPKVPWAY